MKPHAFLIALTFPLVISTAQAADAPAAETAPVTITRLFKQESPEQKDRDIIVQRIDIQPDSGAPPHVHPGMVTGYVVSGIFEFQIEGGPLQTLKAGDTFFEPPGSHHIVGRNPSKTENTVLVAFVVNPKNSETALPIHDHQ